MNPEHCALCGQRRSPLHVRRGSFGFNDLMRISDVRELLPGRAEASPDAMLHMSISVRRNGGEGSDTHICDGCVAAGLRHINQFINDTLIGLDAL